MPISQTESYFENLKDRFVQKTYALSVDFKTKPLRKSVFLYKEKPTRVLS